MCSKAYKHLCPGRGKRVNVLRVIGGEMNEKTDVSNDSAVKLNFEVSKCLKKPGSLELKSLHDRGVVYVAGVGKAIIPAKSYWTKHR